ncbi:hexosaminidase D-like [Oratosquilla oratoria]|uniref:hexosaminidase D-like n=1 Tax=Oratosquilla oratoria TaxID=337810 RepID=UPI003F76B978
MFGALSPRRTGRLITLVAFFMVVLMLFYLISSPVAIHTQPLPNSQQSAKPEHSSNLMTQSPEHLKRQKEIEKKILANVEKMVAHRDFQHKAGRDPVGIVLNRKPSIWDGLEETRNIQEEQNRALHNSAAIENQLKHKIVHFDLKGAPPKVSYLAKLFPMLKTLGATGILMEYEDMFPYWGKLERLSAQNAYAKGDIADILELARKNGLEVIPLVQTFGHLEFVLKLKEFSDVREVPQYPQVICPTKNKTMPLITMMIDQIMELHPGVNWIHIGSDEVYNLGECSRCQQYLFNHQWGKSDLFLYHVTKIAKYVKDSFDVQPIMWDDEFRKVPLKLLQKADIAKYIEVMVWKYSSNIMADLRSELWEKYSIVFNGVWIASAFKGASAPESYITNINERLANHKEWMELVDVYQGTIPFRGIALTGWQRFDHFSVLCELFPQGIPSLAVNLMYVSKRKADHTALARVGEILNCNSFLNLDLQFIEYENKCNFPGSKVYEIVQKLYILTRDIQNMLKNPHVTGWVTDYNIKNNFASPQHVEQGLQDLSMLLFDFGKLLTEAEIALSEVYDEHTVTEWIALNLHPMHAKLQDLHKTSTKLLEKKHWPRRPLDMEEDKEL